MIPSILTAGDTWEWTDSAFGTYSSATHLLTYVLRGVSAIDPITVADGTGWKTTATAELTENLTAGVYQFAKILTSATERSTVQRGTVVINVNLALQTDGYDGRSAAEIALAHCEAALANWNASGGATKSWEIAGRRMEFHSVADIIRAISYWKTVVRNEQAAHSIANGRGDPRFSYARFN